MAILENRIKALEKKQNAAQHEVFIYSIDDVVPLGWYFNSGTGERVCIMRLPDETDEALQTRAVAAALSDRPSNPPSICQISEHLENNGGFILPKILSHEEWERAAAEQQDALVQGESVA